jgi:hypothetical protein
MILLSIQIPTVVGREDKFNKLMQLIERQLYYCKRSRGLVEVISCKDNKEMSIGAKRQKLYEDSKGLFSVQIDDDDTLHDSFIDNVINALTGDIADIDCVTYNELCFIKNHPRKLAVNKFVSHSIKYDCWMDNFDGYDHVRTPYHKDVIRTSLCLQAGVPDVRFNEDEQFSKLIKPLLKKEIHIDEYLYIYQYNYEPHNQKYGIK